MKRVLQVLMGCSMLLYAGSSPATEPTDFKTPSLWEYSNPLVAPAQRDSDQSRAQKDPSVVFHEGKWHLFMTVKLPGRSAIEYCSFENWEDANQSPRTILKISESDYYCAPQVFYFAPHDQWYLIYQMGVPGAKHMWVAYSTTTTIADPDSWTPAKPILDGGDKDPRQVGGLDYWIVCDNQRAYLFLTSLNGKMWRLWTTLEDFPRGFDHFELALEAEIFEASHTYRLKGLDQYLTIIEQDTTIQQDGRRHYKAYLADRLDGPWSPLADTSEKPFAGWTNVQPASGVVPWTDNISHGELVRDGVDQTLTVDPDHLRFIFQGMLEKDKSGKAYGSFSWRIGMLTPVTQLEANYRALVAELPPDQQAWERVLQENLGNFYLPIHKRQKVAGQSNAWDFVQDDPNLPRVLLIGDSVSRGYTQAVRKALADKANVHRAPENCGPTATGLKKLDVWLGDGKWDVIHFNFGIHDRNTPLADYAQRLEQVIQRMQQTGAKLIWASTTPIPDVPEKKQTAASIVERNKAAAEVVQKRGIVIDDLFTAITPRLEELQNPNDVHFSGKGYVFLGQQVAKSIEETVVSAVQDAESAEQK